MAKYLCKSPSKKPQIFWLSMLGVVGIIVAALVWSIFWRLPITVGGNGVLVPSDFVNGIHSEAQGVLAEITVSQGDTITRGQVVATIEDRDAAQELEKRIAAVEAVTLTSEDDVMSADTQDLLEIKSALRTSEEALLQSQSTLDQYLEQLSAERSTLNRLAAQLANAKRDYDNAIQSNTGGTDLRVAYENAEQAYQAAAAQLEAANRQRQSAWPAWNVAQSAVADEAAAYQAAKAAVEESERAIDEKNRLDAANAAVTSAEAEVVSANTAKKSAQKAVEDAQNAVDNGDPNSEGYAGLQEALNQAKRNLEQAERDLEQAWNTLNAAESNPDRLLTPKERDIDEYPARAAALADREAELSSAKAACGYDTCQAAYIAAENAYNQADAAFKAAEQAYLEAKRAYDAHQSEPGASDAEVSRKAAAYQAARTKYNTQQSIVAELEEKVLSARAQVDSDSAQIAALRDQFETTKASILSQLRAELEQAERSLTKTDITSPRDGVVAELPVAIGAMVGEGTEIVKLSGLNDSGADDNTVVICYIPLSSGKKVAEGMTVMVYPTTVNKRQYGHMEATVLSVDNYEASAAEMRNLVGDDLLVQSVTQEGPVLAVICGLRTDSSTASGYYWSSAKAKDILLAESTPVSVDVVIDRKAPITMLIPFLKEKFSMEG